MLTGKKHTETDTLLLSELRRGSKQAFDRIYEAYRQDVYQEAVKRLHDREQAKDVVQDVFTSLWVKASEQAIDNLPGYLYISIRNKVFRLMQRQDKFQPLPDLLQELQMGGEASDHAVLYKELVAAYEALIADLPEQQRIIYHMRFQEDRSPEEIAEILNLSPKTVRNHLGRAIARLRSAMMLAYIVYWVSSR